MINLTYKDINSPAFMRALLKLTETELPFKTSYAIGRLYDKTMSKLNEAQGEYKKHIADKIEWEEIDGNKQPKNFGEYNNMLQEFLATEFTVEKVYKIEVSELTEAKLSAKEINSLAPVLSGLETITEGEHNG